MTREHDEEEKRDLLTLEQIEEVVRERMLITGVIKPTAIVEGERGRRFIVVDGLGETSDERTRTMMETGYHFGRQGQIGQLLQMTFIAEAWFNTAKSEDTLLPPSKDPQRKECVVIAQARLEARSTAVRLLEIVRDNADEFQYLRPVDTGTDRPEKLDSPLINAFVYGYWVGSTSSAAQNPLEKRQ